MKQVIVLRKDLKMRLGKSVAQGCHASYMAIQKATKAQVKEWLEKHNQTKICVSVDSVEELDQVWQAAIDNKLPCSYVIDIGKTEFNGVATPTAVAIGPANSEDIDKITGKLKLL